MMLSVFMAASSARGDDERVVGPLGHLPEIRWRAAPHARDGLGRAALVAAQPAIHPVDLAAVLLGRAHQRGDHVLGDEMVLLLDAAAMHRIGMRLLREEGLQHRAFIGEDVDGVAAPRRDVDEAERRRSARALVGRVHQGDGDGFLVGHGLLPQCQMTLAPAARASITVSSGAAATPWARRRSSMPRSRNEKLSASTRTPAPASRARSPERAPCRAGSTPFWTRNRVTSIFAAASWWARSAQKRVSFESNGSRDSINRYRGMSYLLCTRIEPGWVLVKARTSGRCSVMPGTLAIRKPQESENASAAAVGGGACYGPGRRHWAGSQQPWSPRHRSSSSSAYSTAATRRKRAPSSASRSSASSL